jgi:hypothetical protein
MTLSESVYAAEIATARAQLVATAADLRTAIAAGADPDARAYAALVRDGDVQPYTREAEALWLTCPGTEDWRRHDLAILLHANAYDLEAAGAAGAEEYWRRALVEWAAVHADDAFWTRLAAHVERCSGDPLDPALVAEIRAGLPRELLDVHRSLVERYRGSERTRAAAHMRVLREAPFPAAVKDELRGKLASPAVDAALESAELLQHEAGLARLEDALRLDPDHPELVRTFLYVTRRWNERLWNEHAWDTIRANTRRADEALGALGARLDDARGPVRGEIARLRYWLAVGALYEARDLFEFDAPRSVVDDADRLAAQAIERFDEAHDLDGELTIDAYYGDIDDFRGHAFAMRGKCELVRGTNGNPGAFPVAVRHFRRARELDPDDLAGRIHLVQALIACDDSDRLDEAEQELRQAHSHAESGASSEIRDQLTMLDGIIKRRRAGYALRREGSLDPEDVGAVLALLAELAANAQEEDE